LCLPPQEHVAGGIGLRDAISEWQPELNADLEDLG
jgi:hypothetical protein